MGRMDSVENNQSLPLALQRLVVSASAVVSVGQAARLLPIGPKDARRWLRNRGLVRDLDGRSVVVWGDVVRELGRPAHEHPAVRALPREKL